MRKFLPALALALLLVGCSAEPAPTPAPSSTPPPVRVTPPALTIPDAQPESAPSSGTESSPDRVLASLTAAVSGGRSLRLDAIGDYRTDRRDHCGIREVQVYENGAVIQAVPADSAPLSDSGSGYTESASVDGAMAVRDMNFDGYDDLELSDWSPSGTNPHHFWLWDADAGQYRYAFTLRGAAPDTEARQITASYNEGGKEYLDAYRYAGPFTLDQISRRTEDWKSGTEDFPLVDIYAYENGVEYLVREEYTDYNNDGAAMREVRMLVDGVLTPVLMERLEMIDGELSVVETTAVEPPQNPEEGGEPYPWEEYLEPDGEAVPEYAEYPDYQEDLFYQAEPEG